MVSFMNNNFLLDSDIASRLYQNYAKSMPIYDFHCHLDIEEIYQDKKYENITQLWLYGDHYKWRIMREYGIDEDYITGNKSDKEKFFAFVEMLQSAVGNPIYHWAHLELKRFFGVDLPILKENSQTIWDKANKKISSLSARKCISMSNVNTIFTTDDPTDSLKYHLLLKEDKDFNVEVKPTFRPDNALNLNAVNFIQWISDLAGVAEMPINTIDDLCCALKKRIDFFDSVGCVCADIGMDNVMFQYTNAQDANTAFLKALAGEHCSVTEEKLYKGYLLVFLGKQFTLHHWAQQYHMGVMRNVSARKLNALGVNSGFDCMSDDHYAHELAGLLSKLDETDELPRTVLFCANPASRDMLSSLKNCFNDSVAGKIQLGISWWFNDHLDGIQKQFIAMASGGLISQSVGMLTDSRSFLSYVRHEYFRRILCNYFAEMINKGQFVNDLELIGGIVQDICYNNAKKYFSKQI